MLNVYLLKIKKKMKIELELFFYIFRMSICDLKYQIWFFFFVYGNRTGDITCLCRMTECNATDRFFFQIGTFLRYLQTSRHIIRKWSVWLTYL